MTDNVELSYKLIDGVYYGYDDNGNLIHTKNSYNSYEQWWTYDANGNKTEYKDSMGDVKWWTYDSNGECTNQGRI